MNIEQLKSIISQARQKAAGPEVVRMIDALEAFIDLYFQRDQPHANSRAFVEKLHTSYRDMWDAFNSAAEGFGLTGEMVHQRLMNPSDFTPEQWQMLESLKQDIGSIGKPSTSQDVSKKAPVRKLRKHKKVRI